jgi:hypothetical protein
VDVTGRGVDQHHVHRVICWPTYSEFAIVFRTLAMRLEPVAGRAFRRQTPVYRELPVRTANCVQPTAACAF